MLKRKTTFENGKTAEREVSQGEKKQNLADRFVLTAHSLIKAKASIDSLEEAVIDSIPFKIGDIISKVPIPNNQTEFGNKVVGVRIDRSLITYTDKPADRVCLICPIELTLAIMKDANTPKENTWVAPLIVESDGSLYYHSHKYNVSILKKGK